MIDDKDQKTKDKEADEFRQRMEYSGDDVAAVFKPLNLDDKPKTEDKRQKR